jgi:WD40 repeat protein
LLPVLAAAEPGPAPREVRLDVNGDVLPPGVVARLGSTRFQEIQATRVTVSPDGKQAVCVDDHNVRVWDLATGKLAHVWPLPGDTLDIQARRPLHWDPYKLVGSTSVSDDGRTAVRIRQHSADGVYAVADVWDLPTQSKVRSFSVKGAAAFLATAIRPDGRFVVTSDYHLRPHRIRLWDVRTGDGRVLGAHDGAANQLLFVDGGRKVLAVLPDGDACVHDLETGKEVYRVPLPERPQVISTRDGTRFVIYSPPANVTVYDAATGKPVPGFMYPDAKYYTMPRALSDDGTMMVCYRASRSAIWNFATGCESVQLPLHHFAATTFAPDGKSIVCAGGGLWVLESATGKELAGPDPKRGPPGGPSSFGWDSDGTSILLAGPASTFPVTIYDPETGKVTRQVKSESWVARWFQPGLHSAHHAWEQVGRSDLPFTAFKDAAGRPAHGDATVSGDTRLLALRSVRPDFTLRIETSSMPIYRRPTNCYDVAVHERFTGAELFKRSIPVVGEVAFSQDNRRLATLEPDRLRVWDVVTGKLLVEHRVTRPDRPPKGGGFGSALAFSPDNRRCAVNNRDGTVLIWDVSINDDRKPLKANELSRLWNDFAVADPKVGWRAVHRFMDDLGKSVPFLIERLQPALPPTTDAAKRLLADLNAPAYRTREAATKSIWDLGDSARLFLDASMKNAQSIEVRKRLESLRAEFKDGDPPYGDDLRRLRALAVLERAGTRAARAKIDELATGLPAARVTLEAKELQRRLLERDRAEGRSKG